MPIGYAEAIRRININKFVYGDNLDKDALRYCQEYKWDKRTFYYIRLRLSFGPSITAHTLTDSVVKKILATRLCSIPTALPDFLTKPFIISARHDKTLINDITCISGYLNSGELVLISIRKDGNSIIQHCSSFDGRSIFEVSFSTIGVCEKRDEKNADRIDVLAFAVVFSLMLEADRTPIAVENSRPKVKVVGTKLKQKKFESGWIEKRVFIDKKYIAQYKNDIHGELDIEGKILKDVHVRGFLRYQAYGHEHRMRKWIYVEGFDSSRWAYPGHTKVTVDMHEKS